MALRNWLCNRDLCRIHSALPLIPSNCGMSTRRSTFGSLRVRVAHSNGRVILENMPSTIPPRLHVLLARQGFGALVLRRGPSKTTCAIGWDRQNDTFKVGQWVRARIYERRCDLSPDGSLFLYFAHNGRANSPTRGSWTAVSRVPYLKAIALWANGSAWAGGGLFLGNSRFWLNDHPPFHSLLYCPSSLVADTRFPFDVSFGGECPGVYVHRLQRDGWIARKFDNPDVFDKPICHGWSLRKLAYASFDRRPGKGVYFDEHELHGPSGQLYRHPEWEWADWDGKRLLFATGGALWACQIVSGKPSTPCQLADFNDMEFQALPAPYTVKTPRILLPPAPGLARSASGTSLAIYKRRRRKRHY